MEKKWRVLDPAPQSFYDEYPELPPTVLNLLYHRNITKQEKIDEFLNPDYSKDIHDPFLFQHMENAVKRIDKAIQNNEKIIIHGDYDADGVCASVILVSTLQVLGAKDIDTFLPHREIDGYGLNKNTVQKFIEQKINLVITCDCGISNTKEMKICQENNIDVIITDHHTVPEILPPASAIIHPQIKEEKYPDKTLCGGAVAFKLAQALIKNYAKNNAHLPNGESPESFEKWLLDLVAIASVADMVPIMGETRTLTKYGLIVLNKTRRIGLQKLLLEARLMEEDGSRRREFDTDNIGFQIAPRINAAGRMDHANAAYDLLLAKENDEAAELARALDQNNQERQKTTDELVKKACEQIEKEQKDEPVIFILGENWPTGIVGLIASRLKEKYYKPAIVMGKSEGEITGSGRSIDGFDLIRSLQEIPQCFSRFGGHPMACGFTLQSEKSLEEFKQKLKQDFLTKTAGLNISPTLEIDAEIDLDGICWDLFDLLEKFKPFGIGNQKPKYLARNLTITKLESVGKDGKHLRLLVKHNSPKTKKILGWNLCRPDSDDNWCKKLAIGDKIDVVFEISVNEWNGNRELQLTIVDLHHSS